MDIPVYLFTGFLESGKTSFIKDTIADPDFIDGNKTLIVLCEEGMEEFDEAELAKSNISIVTVEEEESLTEEFFQKCEATYQPVRILIEYNGMWNVTKLVEEILPEHFTVVQIISTIDARTFEMYNANMKSLLMEQVGLSDLVVFNRCTEETKKGNFKRSIKAVNRKAAIFFEGENGEPMPETDEDLPYDIHAKYLELSTDDYGVWYMDAMEHPKKYAGKTVKFQAVVYKNRNFASDTFVPGRFAMTCCADDIAFLGFVCIFGGTGALAHKEWIEIEAEIRCEYRKEYKGKGPVLYAKEVTPSTKPEDDLVYFN